jgi:hypothetical protein
VVNTVAFVECGEGLMMVLQVRVFLLMQHFRFGLTGVFTTATANPQPKEGQRIEMDP